MAAYQQEIKNELIWQHAFIEFFILFEWPRRAHDPGHPCLCGRKLSHSLLHSSLIFKNMIIQPPGLGGCMHDPSPHFNTAHQEIFFPKFNCLPPDEEQPPPVQYYNQESTDAHKPSIMKIK